MTAAPEQPRRERRGRPRASSVATLAESASELFLEQGFESTTVDDIASRAGVSRNTFFGYFSQKADVLWVELDAAIARVAPVGAVDAAGAAASLVAAVEPWGEHVPWALRDMDAMGTAAVMRLTAFDRVAPVAERVALAVALDDDGLPEDARPSAIAGALVGATVAALLSWAQRYPDRGTASAAVAAALEPLEKVLA